MLLDTVSKVVNVNPRLKYVNRLYIRMGSKLFSNCMSSRILSNFFLFPARASKDFEKSSVDPSYNSKYLQTTSKTTIPTIAINAIIIVAKKLRRSWKAIKLNPPMVGAKFNAASKTVIRTGR